MPKLSVTIITKNEAADIGQAIATVSWADEVLVVDAESHDETRAIAERLGCRVLVRPWDGYVSQKNFAAGAASHDWILSLDADERITPALADEVQAMLGSEPAARGYRLPRVTWHLGRWIRSTDWFPDHQLRLYDRRHGRWDGRHVHESVRVEGAVGTLKGEIQHYAYRDIADHLETIDRYTTLAARQMHERGRRAGAADLLLQAPAAFARNYLLRGGFRDGTPGLIVSVLNAYYVFLKFAKLWELSGGTTPHSTSDRA